MSLVGCTRAEPNSSPPYNVKQVQAYEPTGSRNDPFEFVDKGISFYCLDGYLYFSVGGQSIVPYMSANKYRAGEAGATECGKH